MSTVIKQVEQLRWIPMDLIDTTVECRPVNQAHVLRLKDSINEIGVEQPVVAYQRGERYILGPGRHRYEACKLLEHAEIPAIVRPDAPDAQIRQAQMIENLQRENMNPLEEAQACEQLLDEYQGNVDRVAVVLGRSRKWVEQRLSFARLSPRVHEMIVDGTLPLEYAYLIARVTSHEKQEEIAGQAAVDKSNTNHFGHDTEEGRPEEPLWRVREMVEDAMRTLKGVPWLLDAEFADKPACANCPSNSLNQPMLFSDGKKKDAECLDAECYAHKSKVAGSAVRKAVNFIGKESLSATPANAEKAIEAREVSFVDPKVVAAQAKQKAAPKEQTDAERSGRSRAQEDYRFEHEFRSRRRNWANTIDGKLVAKIRKNKVLIGMLMLLKEVPEFDELERYDDNSDKKKPPKQAALEAAVGKLLDLFKAPSGDALAKLAGKLEMPGEFVSERWPLPYNLHDSVRVKLCQIFDVERPDPPTLKQVKAEMTKAAEELPQSQAEESAAPSTTGKASKKKTAGKKKKPGKKK